MPLTLQFHGNNYEMTDQVTAKHRRYKLLCWRALCCGKDIINSRHIKYFSKDTITHKNMFSQRELMRCIYGFLLLCNFFFSTRRYFISIVYVGMVAYGETQRSSCPQHTLQFLSLCMKIHII